MCRKAAEESELVSRQRIAEGRGAERGRREWSKHKNTKKSEKFNRWISGLKGRFEEG